MIDHKHDDLILLVDDDPTILGTSRMMLEALGFPVIAASSSREALEAIKEDSNQVRLVLTDLSMPDMDGRELAVKLRELNYTGPIAVVSGYALDLEELGSEFVGVLMKPFRLNELASRVEEYLGRPSA
ncbi:response regulator [bacterium]|nr:response regulator [bacterium]